MIITKSETLLPLRRAASLTKSYCLSYSQANSFQILPNPTAIRQILFSIFTFNSLHPSLYLFCDCESMGQCEGVLCCPLLDSYKQLSPNTHQSHTFPLNLYNSLFRLLFASIAVGMLDGVLGCLGVVAG